MEAEEEAKRRSRRTFEVAAKTELEPPQQVKTRCTACTQPLQCQWTIEA
jgi:hypothetical protein